jgi:GNAT superfamily N-acetyltransferase
MSNTPRIKIDLTPSDKDDGVIRKGLHEFNVIQIGEDQHYSVFAYDPEGTIIGGILVYAETQSIFLDNLWVEESHRKIGLGTKLLNAAEEEGIRRKISFSTVDTYEFQAGNFYIKNGYTQFGMIKDYIEGYDRLFFRKKVIT